MASGRTPPSVGGQPCLAGGSCRDLRKPGIWGWNPGGQEHAEAHQQTTADRTAFGMIVTPVLACRLPV